MPVEVYRFVPTDDREAAEFTEAFRSDKARGTTPSAREQRFPELHEGISSFRTLELARARWWRIARRVGEERIRMGRWIARLRLEPGNGFAYERNDDPEGHLYAWGDEVKLAQAVVEIVSVQPPPDESG